MKMMIMNKSYSELVKLQTLRARFEYLKLSDKVGKETFGFDRYLNQRFYKSAEWKRLRDEIIIRDNGCDMGLEDYPINGRIIIHHMNPLTPNDILFHGDFLLNTDNLICVSHNTHNAIHYGNFDLIDNEPIIRTKNDTCPWR